jgi:glyoxylase-like metal-dependent hydrolase (beta-lactamase superfamily II)
LATPRPFGRWQRTRIVRPEGRTGLARRAAAERFDPRQQGSRPIAIVPDMSSSGRRGTGGIAANVTRAPVRELPSAHLITLPTPWEVSYVQVYLVESDPLTLIDTGVANAASRDALASALESLGYGIEDLQRVIITHYHRDHLGQAEALRRAADDLEVWAHQDAVPMIEAFSVERDENLEGTTALFHEYGVPGEVIESIVAERERRMQRDPVLCEATRVDRVLRHGDQIEFKDFSFDVIHSPGHTAGHVLFHHAESGVLFSGDQILGGAVPNTENYYVDGLPDPADPLRRRPRFKGLLQYRNSLRALRRQTFSAILPAFGGVIRVPERAIGDALLYYEVRIQRIERSLRSVTALGQSVTAYEIWHSLFPNDDPATQMKTRLLMVIGALDVLEDLGQCVTARRDDGVLIHRHSE